MLTKYITWFALLMHYTWGALLLIYPDPMFATPIHSVAKVFGFNHLTVAFVFLFVATAALWGIWLDRGPGDRHDILVLTLLTPQQIILWINAGGAIAAVMRSAYADGVSRHFAFILGDQVPIILAAIIYSAAIVEHYGRPNKWKHFG